jgi:hypothetical protein
VAVPGVGIAEPEAAWRAEDDDGAGFESADADETSVVAREARSKYRIGLGVSVRVFVNDTEEHSVSVAEAANPKPRLGLTPVIATSSFDCSQQNAVVGDAETATRCSRREVI